MLTYMLDTNICIYVMKNYPLDLREKFNSLAEQLCISSITLGELHYGAEKSARRVDNLTAIEHFVARLDVLPFEAKAAAHYGPTICASSAACRESGLRAGSDRSHQTSLPNTVTHRRRRISIPCRRYSAMAESLSENTCRNGISPRARIWRPTAPSSICA